MTRVLAAILLLASVLPAWAHGQEYGPPSDPAALQRDYEPRALPLSAFGVNERAGGDPVLNPLTVLSGAAEAFAGRSGATGDASGSERPGLSATINIMILLTVLTLVPSIVLMTTCFLRIIIVLGLLKQALGTQSLPPSQVVTGLALFMTLLVMMPTVDRIWNEAVTPYTQGEIRDYDDLWQAAKTPVRDFMFNQIEATGNWSSLYMVLNYRGVDTSDPAELTRADVDMVSLVPAYMLSELKTAFLMGFRVYLPFLVIDMVIASLLISMSMMMLPPILISLPFKLMLFVMVDGWTLVVGSLLASFAQGGSVDAAVDGAVTMLPVAPAIGEGLIPGVAHARAALVLT
ncbi:MAG: flagellar type III secretion system pore protein FliP [Planctomycetota bacterium]